MTMQGPPSKAPQVEGPQSQGPKRRDRGILTALFIDASPIDMRIVGRTLLHAALVGAAAGFVAVMLFAALELIEQLVLERLAGYEALRAHGEMIGGAHKSGPFRPWLLIFIPAVGALVSGCVSTFIAPEVRGGGGDAMITAFHQRGGIIRRRVIWAKALASVFTLGTGGAGGREGPTMQIGGAIGSFVAQSLRIGVRERRILMIAGVAAGMAAIFRTPLGAALLAVEVLYRDDFESDALIPALLASVIAYSVFISFFGESTLFAHSARYPFIPRHLPLYGLLALLLALLATIFLTFLNGAQRISATLPVPEWARPAMGGLALGLLATVALVFAGRYFLAPGQGLGLFGGGYGAAQAAITGASWLPGGWKGVQVLLLLCAAKIVATSCTVGTGGSAGDFAPSLAVGGLFGGAFGRALAILLKDPTIDPGAFALVGMGTFYGGIAHVPISSLVMVCELAGSYDLLVPLMLAEGIAFVALRKRQLYHAQVPTQRDSPAHPADLMDVMAALRVRDIMIEGREYVSFELTTPVPELLRRVSDTSWQDVFPVLDPAQKMAGMVTSDMLRILAMERELEPWALAADAMQPAVTIRPDDDLRSATEAMLAHGVREVPVVDDGGHIVGFLDEADVGKAYLDATRGDATRAAS